MTNEWKNTSKSILGLQQIIFSIKKQLKVAEKCKSIENFGCILTGKIQKKSNVKPIFT